MRVIAGKFKNKKIKTAIKGVKCDFRPTKSIVREAVFNIIMNHELNGHLSLAGAHVVDTFCGSGAYGIEALSRGAERATFINNDRRALDIVKFNVNALQDQSVRAEYRCQDATLMQGLGEGVDIIFIDPPYRTNLHYQCLSRIASPTADINLKKGHLIFLELAKYHDFEAPEAFELLNVKAYGNTEIIVLQKKNA